MRINHLIGFLAVSVLILGCASGRHVVIPEDVTPEELIQRGQEASDRNRYKLALRYYEAVLERYASNSDLIIAAEYEIAFIHYKKKRYSLSKDGFNAILERYNGPDEEILPPQFKILSAIVLERIAEKEKPGRFSLRRKKPPEGNGEG
jgi:outer membrane protein assembly factor BamD (BamD/ComL family)